MLLSVPSLTGGLEGDGGSVYFTPAGTPAREAGPGPHRRSHRRMVSNLSSFLPFWWGMGQGGEGVQSGEASTTVAIVEPRAGEEQGEAQQVVQTVEDAGTISPATPSFHSTITTPSQNQE